MHAHYFQHVSFEGLGSIEHWLRHKGFSVSCTQLFKVPVFPDPQSVDFLIVMGGPMSVNDEDTYPWLKEEKRFIHNFIASGKPVLGICLGAQLIASALGSRIYPNGEKEIGWFPIQAVPVQTGTNTFSFPTKIDVFHWHGETFDLPPKAQLLASSKACENQAFQIADSVIALQFHLETTAFSANDIIEHCRQELSPAHYVQSEETLISSGPAHYEAINSLMNQVLDYLVD